MPGKLREAIDRLAARTDHKRVAEVLERGRPADVIDIRRYWIEKN
jgi:hypothetical protein